MNRVEKFVKRFEEKTGIHPNDFKQNPNALATILSGDEELRELFKAAQEA